MSSAGPPVPPPGNKGAVIGLLVLITGIVIAGGVTYQLAGARDPAASKPGPAGAAATSVPSTSPSGSAGTEAAAPSPSIRRSVQLDAPPPGFEESSRPLGTPPAKPAPSNAFAFYQLRSDGSPVTFDPCRPLHYVIRPDGAPAGGERLIRSAIDEVAKATGLRIVYDGPTDERPDRARKAYDPLRNPERWAPFLVAWESPSRWPDLAGDPSHSPDLVSVVTVGRPDVYVSGTIVLDGPQIGALVTDPARARELRARLLAAAASMVGLGETDERGQMMSRTEPYGTRTDFGPGDRFGLAELGSGPCAPWL